METRELILESAKKLFLKHGFAATSVKQIGDAANIPIETINFHFQNKEILFDAILKTLKEENYYTAFEALDTPETEEGLKLRLALFLDCSITTYLDNPDVYMLIMKEYDSNSPELQNYLYTNSTNAFHKLVNFFESSKKTGLVDQDLNSGFVATMIYNHLTNQLRMNKVSRAQFGTDLSDSSFRKAWISDTVNLIVNGIKNKSDTF